MRGLKSTIVLLAVLIGLSAYIYFVTWNQPDSVAENARDRVFAALESDDIDEITVKADNGETTTLTKAGTTWQLTAPRALKADTSEAASLTTNLSSIEVARVVDENPADLKEYGLDPPRVEIEFKATGDEAYAGGRTLMFGAKSPTGELFAKQGGETRVILVPGYMDAIFNRTTFNLRDKSLLAFERDKIDRITVSTPGGTLEFMKEGMEWRLVRPVAALADTVAVDALINRLSTVQMKSIVTEDPAPADLKQYGFDRPQGTFTVAAGDAAASLTVGGKAGEELYVRDASRPLVATAEASLLTDLEKDADDYRRKEIFAFRGYSGDRLEFTRDGQTITFEKTTAEGQPDTWRRTAPTAGEPETMNMESLLLKLEGLRATSFRDSTAGTGLDKPLLTVYARSEEGKKEERVSFARGSGTGGDAYAAVPGQPGAVVIPGMTFDEMLSALELVSK